MSNFNVKHVSDFEVMIEDISDRTNTRSITNDADRVCAELYKRYGNVQFFYIDTMGNVDELVHKHGEFVCFSPARGKQLPDDAVAVLDGPVRKNLLTLTHVARTPKKMSTAARIARAQSDFQAIVGSVMRDMQNPSDGTQRIEVEERPLDVAIQMCHACSDGEYRTEGTQLMFTLVRIGSFRINLCARCRNALKGAL